jgi:transposase
MAGLPGVCGRPSCSRRDARVSRSHGCWGSVTRACGGGNGCGRRAALMLQRRRPATGRPPNLDDDQAERVRTALEQGAQAHGFEADPWTLERVGLVVERVAGVSLSRMSMWRLLTGRLGWSLQRPERRAVSGTSPGPPAGSRTSGRASKRGGEHTCLDRLPRRIRRLAAAPSPTYLRAPPAVLRSCGIG